MCTEDRTGEGNGGGRRGAGKIYTGGMRYAGAKACKLVCARMSYFQNVDFLLLIST